MRWQNFEAVRELLAETASMPDTYITLSHLLPDGRESQVGSRPWDDWREVRSWLKKTVKKLDPGPEGVKVRTRVFRRGGKPVRGVVSLVQGDGKGPPAPSAPPVGPGTSATSLPPVAPAVCPSCVATQAILATKQLQVVDLEARLERSRGERRELEGRLGRSEAARREAQVEKAALLRRIRELDHYRSTIEGLLASLPDQDPA